MCHLHSCKTPLCLLSWLQIQYREPGSALWITVTFSSASLGPKQFYVEPGRVLCKGPSVVLLQSAFTTQRWDGLEACLLGRCSPTPSMAGGPQEPDFNTSPGSSPEDLSLIPEPTWKEPTSPSGPLISHWHVWKTHVQITTTTTIS